MIGALPTSLQAGGVMHPIRSDYRVVLRIFEAFSDPDLTEEEKAMVCLLCLYEAPEAISAEHLEEAIRQAFWFCDGGDMPKTEPEKIRTMDWKHDESILFPAVSKAAGFEVRSCAYLHWWVFLGYFGEVGEGLFSTVMHIRQKRARSKPLEKWEAEFCRRNPALIALRTAEEQAAIDETEALLREIL